jgi:hypothetical protein
METKENLIEIARELKLNNILDNANISDKEILLAILKKKKNYINWNDMKYANFGNVDFKQFLTDKEDIPHADYLGPVSIVDSYGGEGKGDDYWLVAYFSKYDTYIRMDGWYVSYDGGKFDGDPYIVEPQEKIITVYNAV